MKNLFAGKKGRKAVEKGKKAKKPMTSTTTLGKRNEIEQFLDSPAKSVEVEGDKKPVKGCVMIVCEDPLTGDYRAFPFKCPPGYVEKMRSRMREKGVRFSSKPFPEDAVLSIPEEEL